MWNPYLPLSDRERNTAGAISVAVVITVWTLLSGLQIVPPAQLPSPLATLSALGRLAWDPARGESLLLEATLWSAGRVAVAGVLVVLVGVPIGVLMGASPRVNAALSPLIDPFRSAPVVALLPILVMWLGIGELMKVAFLFVGAVVYLIPLVRDALRAVPQTYWVSARDLGATPWEAVMGAVLPMSKPRIADAIVVSVSVMWTYITVAEYVNAQKGLGQLIQNARRFSAMDQVFAGILVIVALALLTYRVMTALKRRLYPWEAE
jgi:ABC-type nitrate/sulfonate/bicarbonate transport system permease component